MKIKITVLSLILLFFTNFSFASSDYPKSKVEREIDEMGSLLGGEGIVFRPGKVKSTSTKAKIGNVNKYLFQASIDVLNFAPLASADSNGGVIVTEWYNPKDQPNTQFKINVFIKDDVISSEGLEVTAYERTKKNGKWSEDYKTSSISGVIEDKILRKARDLYLQSSKK